MEEEKKVQPQNNGQNGQGQGGQGGRHRRRHKKKGGNGGNGQNGGNAVNAQGGQTSAQQPQNQQKQPQPQQNKQGQNQQNANKGNQQKQNPPQNANKPQQNQQLQQKQKNQQPQPQQKQPQPQQADKNAKKQQENRKDTYAYPLDGNLYINLTNKCSNGCDFCVRNERTSYFGHYLWINHGDPTAEKVVAACNALGDLTKFKEIVFCGFGEPTYRMEQMLALCDYFHAKGLKTRLNTNGQGVLINKRDIVPEMKGKIDKISISLNASCAEKYQKICRSQFGENGFGAMIEFAKACKRAGFETRFTLVDYVGEEEVELCKKLAQSVNVPLVVRKYIADCW